MSEINDPQGKSPVVANPWAGLRRFTSARIALGRTGTSLPTAPHLEFQLAHARARNAVHHDLDASALAAGLRDDGHEVLVVASAAPTRPIYLQRPDLGRRLSTTARSQLQALTPPQGGFDLVFVVADGLSALAIEQNVRPFLAAVRSSVQAEGWRVAPLIIAKQARVALGDEVGELLGARLVVVLIGERPGLSSPDSMGLYLTYGPKVGLTDESRNCISNVRPEGLSYDRAAHKMLYLAREALKRQFSGVLLKDEAEDVVTSVDTVAAGNFLTSG